MDLICHNLSRLSMDETTTHILTNFSFGNLSEEDMINIFTPLKI